MLAPGFDKKVEIVGFFLTVHHQFNNVTEAKSVEYTKMKLIFLINTQ